MTTPAEIADSPSESKPGGLALEKPSSSALSSSKSAVAFTLSTKQEASNRSSRQPHPLKQTKKRVVLGENLEDDTKNVLSVTGFDVRSGHAITANGGTNENKEETNPPLVIRAVPNKDWRAEVRRVKAWTTYIPDEQKHTQGSDEDLEALVEAEKKRLVIGFNSGTRADQPSPSLKPDDDDKQDTTTQISEDELAKRALLQGKSFTNTGSSGLVIPQPATYPGGDEYDEEEEVVEKITEDEAYVRDVSQRPEAPGLDAYERVPVEEFGAALLRGMGWNGSLDDEETEAAKPGSVGSKASLYGSRDPEAALRRPAFLGLGAKPAGGGGLKETGKRPVDRVYVPVVKIDRETGQVVKDDEESGEESDSGKTKQDVRDQRRNERGREREKSPGYESRSTRDRRRDGDSRHKDRYHGRDRDYERGRYKEGHRDRDRRNADRYHDDYRERDRRSDKYDDHKERDRRSNDRYQDDYRERDRRKDSRYRHGDKNRDQYSRR